MVERNANLILPDCVTRVQPMRVLVGSMESESERRFRSVILGNGGIEIRPWCFGLVITSGSNKKPLCRNTMTLRRTFSEHINRRVTL